MSSLIVPVALIEKILPHSNADALELAHVLVVATLPFSLDEVKRYSEGKTLLMQQDAHIREGVVVKPLRERTDPKLGRVVLKYVSDSYLFGEKTDYTDM
jgi:hypothetical protein